jgi:ComF family protein
MIPSQVYKRPISILYPATCILCGAPGEGEIDLCPGCLADLPLNRHCCPLCALPLPATAPAGGLCGACQRKPPFYKHCIAPLLYQGTLPHLVTGLKFQGRMNYARLLGTLLTTGLEQTVVELPELIVPVPLHPARLRERGFNQALEIARIPARHFGLPIDTECCHRQLATAPQSGLEAKERRRNIRGAFSVTPGLEGRHVVLVDDVVTTGSTVAELARTLKRSGVERVDVWAVAKTP